MSTEIDTTETFIENLFAKNKALYGDARMEATGETEVIEEKPAKGEPETTEETVEETPEVKPDDKESELPEWAQKERTNLRTEAANYRTRLREAEQKLSEAKSPEEVAAAIADLAEKNALLERSLLVRDVASEFKLPKDLADLLKGDDIEALKAHAKILAKFVPTEDLGPESLNGGLDPSNEDDGETDPRKLARRSRRI